MICSCDLADCLSDHVHKNHGEGNGNPLQYSCLRNPTGRGAWWSTVHGVTESQIQLSMHTGTQKQTNCFGSFQIRPWHLGKPSPTPPLPLQQALFMVTVSYGRSLTLSLWLFVVWDLPEAK